ncbi:MAG: BatD family protein [Thiohalocapsa sp.]|uniref:BatD family protein n=1 Tax=Thiohalocapsa sp. TaxID=2497641 RepID=UPI0025CC3D82|nr:BatD family protein [Thiohalocapsa sp.]MCG6943385.1 BatD family protein [Thiohalocapsa sp.]
MNCSLLRRLGPAERVPRVLAALPLALLLLWSGVTAAAVSARFDRDQVYEGESVTLTIESDDLGGGTPDLSALERDFDVLGTSSGSRIEIVNGRQSATRTWQVSLSPKRLGTIQVPPVEVGGERTKSLVLSVSEMPQGASGGPGDDVFVEVSVGAAGDKSVYVQQQVPVTVRLYSALPLRGGDLSDPRPDGAVLERLGDDVQYQANRNGRQYQVIERHFSLSPERSGELRIPPVTFTGELRGTGTGAASPFGGDRLAQLFRDPVFDRFGNGLFDRGEPVRTRSRALTLDVLPRPKGLAGSNWLPATALAIDDSWAHDPPHLTRGEPAERVLTVTATGLAGSQIPEIEMSAPASVRVYPDDPETETRTDGKRLFGVSRQRVSVIPTSGGTLEFPEIRLRWWDINAGKERVAVVPARELAAAGTVDAADVPAAPDQARSATGNMPAPDAAAAPDAPAAGGGAVPAPADRLHATRRPMLWLLPVLLVAGAGLFLWRRRQRAAGWWRGAAGLLGRAWARGPLGRAGGAGAGRTVDDSSLARAAAVAPGGTGERRGNVRKQLQAACSVNDARAAAAALLALVRDVHGPAAPSSLGGVAARFADMGTPAGRRAGAAVRGLEASLYGPSPGEWNGGELAEAVSAVLVAARTQSPGNGDAAEPLAPLYPHRG